MRAFGIFSLVATSIALITAFLALFAGTHNDMLEHYDMLTVNTSRIGVNFFKNQSRHGGSSPSPKNSSGGFFSSLWQNTTSQIANITGDVEDKIQKDLNNVLQSLAKDLGVKDFYSIHIMDHCEGFFKPNTTERNITYCSDADGMSSFNITDTLARELNSSRLNVTLSQLHWPHAITDAENSVKLAFNVSFIIWTIGIVFTCVAWLACLVAIPGKGKKSVSLNVGVTTLACLVLTIAAVVLTVGINKVTDAINKFGSEINVNAARGTSFLALIWTTTALVGVAGIAWMVEFCITRRQQKRMPKPV